MNILDIILLTILAVALIRGLIRGMIRQVASLLGILTGFVVAGHLYLRFLPLFRHHLPSIAHLEVLTYLLVFGITWLVIVLLGLLFVRLSRAMMMGWADRFLGGALGLIKGVVAAVVMVTMLTLFLPAKSPILTGSLLSVHVQKAGYYLVQLIPQDLRHRYEKGHETLVRQLKRQQITRDMERIKR